MPSRRRERPVGDADDRRPRLVTLEEQRAAERALRAAWEAGELDAAECSHRMGLVCRAVTPRDLWKASGHRAGSPRRSNRGEIWRAVRLGAAIVVFAAVAMMLVVYGTILYQQGGIHHTHIWPWQWGQD